MNNNQLQGMNSSIETETLLGLIKIGRAALTGNSNDAEHDALFEIVTALESILYPATPESSI